MNITSKNKVLLTALNAKRHQMGEEAWLQGVAEAKRREDLILKVMSLVESGVPFAKAVKDACPSASESTTRTWIARYEKDGQAALFPHRGRLPVGFPDPVIKENKSPKQSKKTRSFIKWAGSKAGVLPSILQAFPKEYGTYYEPMVGSGVLFFALSPKRAVLGDMNHELIDAFLAVRDKKDELIEALKTYENNSEHYFRARAVDPATLTPLEKAARFIYLNKTCFNGMYRVNQKGQFNVPYGRIAHANICDESTIEWTNRLLQGVEIKRGDVRENVKDAKSGDLVYIDPPYLCVEKRRGHPHLYQPEAFGMAQHQDLALLTKELTERGCRVFVSNSNIPEVHDLYKDFEIRVLEVRRPINRNAKGRDGHKEVIIDCKPTSRTAMAVHADLFNSSKPAAA